MSNVIITDFIVRSWLKSLCKMNRYYYDYLESWDDMSSSEKRSSIKSMQEFNVTKLEDFVEWLHECCA